ncbi:hypothetical protein B9Z55_023823 [Caenorhabditis nigoni]|uniref:Uncharacterized protein n=1 Tax=Caenorhabditis nigoni TaxID=1611254 RepID=A0A2G5SRP4_9PELO|nr:hypothetical protein B9Z55_023823 [Caenorhabditis nigoni]
MFLLSFFLTLSWVADLIIIDEKWVSYSINMRKGQLIDKEYLALDVPEPKFCVKWGLLCIWWPFKGMESENF